jgi:hypothetical protein
LVICLAARAALPAAFCFFRFAFAVAYDAVAGFPATALKDGRFCHPDQPSTLQNSPRAQ